MNDIVIVAIITGICSVIGQWLISRAASAKLRVEDAIRDARQEDRLGRIEKQLSIHNSYAERFGEIQTDIAVIKNEIRNLKG